MDFLDRPKFGKNPIKPPDLAGPPEFLSNQTSGSSWLSFVPACDTVVRA